MPKGSALRALNGFDVYMDHTKNQASWTLLYKKKVTLSTGEKEILYDRLKKVDKG